MSVMQAVKRVLGLVFLFLCLLSGGQARADNFTIKNIDVSRSAKSASVARLVAVSVAQITAYNQLINAVVLPEDKEKLPNLEAKEIGNLVSGYEVTEEKVGEKTYKARFNVTFDRKKVLKMLSEAGVEFVDNVSPNILVIPILQTDNQVLLWEKENQWREAWTRFAADNKSMPLVVPLGDLDDITLLRVEDAFSGQFSALSKLAEKYDTGRILIAEAVYEEEPETGRPSIEVIMRLLQGESIIDRFKTSFSGKPKMAKDAFFDTAVKEASGQLAGSMQSIARVNTSETEQKPDSIYVQVPIQDLSKWNAFKKEVLRVQGVKDIKVENFSSNKAGITILYTGDFSTLTYFLHNAGYSLTNNGDGTWWLKIK